MNRLLAVAFVWSALAVSCSLMPGASLQAQSLDARALERAAREASEIVTQPPSDECRPSDPCSWSRALAIRGGTRVVVRALAVDHDGYVVTATPGEIVVLRLDDELPSSVKKTLLRLAEHRPDYFAVHANDEVVGEGEVQVRSGSVYFRDRKVGDLTSMVERLARQEVWEIRSHPLAPGTFFGDYGGVFVIAASVLSAVWVGQIGHRSFDRQQWIGAVGGAFVGFAAGFSASYGVVSALSREAVIYRAVTK